MTALDPIGEAAAEACGLSTETRMRYWKPAPHLRGCISGYHLYAVSTPAGKPHRDVFQPAWANLRVRLTEGSQWRVRIRGGEWVEPGHVSLFGPSSAISWSECETGLVVGAGILPRGWARLPFEPARCWADRVGDLPQFGAVTAEQLHSRFCGVHQEDDVPAIFDELFTDVLVAEGKDDGAIAEVEAALVDPMVESVSQLSCRTGLSARALERLTHRAFGFPPKLLLRRARFLRSLHAIRSASPADRTAAIDSGYTDYSHFVRDSHDFLGMSPQAFLRLDTPLLRESLALRTQVLGAPSQALADPTEAA